MPGGVGGVASRGVPLSRSCANCGHPPAALRTDHFDPKRAFLFGPGTEGLRKKRPFSDGVANGSNRPQAVFPAPMKYWVRRQNRRQSIQLQEHNSTCIRQVAIPADSGARSLNRLATPPRYERRKLPRHSGSRGLRRRGLQTSPDECKSPCGPAAAWQGDPLFGPRS